MNRKSILRCALAVCVYGFALQETRRAAAQVPLGINEIPPGYEALLISQDADGDFDPQINNCGQVVFSKRVAPSNGSASTEEIYLWDHGRTVRITNDNVRDAWPTINNHATMAWSRARAPTQGESGLERALFTAGAITLLSNDSWTDATSEINDNGQIAMEKISGLGCTGLTIFLYTNQAMVPITNDSYSNQSPRINSSGDIVWTQYDFCASPWRGTIRMIRNGEVIDLSDGLDQDDSPDINDSGQVVWRGPSAQVMIREGGTTRLLADGAVPRINNLGDVAMTHWDPESAAHQIRFYFEGEFCELTAGGPATNYRPSVNDEAEVAWRQNRQNGTGSDIVLMRRMQSPWLEQSAGARDRAAAMVSACMTGPVEWQAGGCANFDRDLDLDVDLRDVAAIQTSLSGVPQAAFDPRCVAGPLVLADQCACRRLDLQWDADIDLHDFVLLQRTVVQE